MTTQNVSVNRAKYAVTDLDGILRAKYVHAKKLQQALETGDMSFCNCVLGWDCEDQLYDNAEYTGWHTGYPDAQISLAKETLRSIPWNDGIPFILANFVNADGTGLSVCPRSVLQRVLTRAEDLGLRPKVGLEFEWFNFAESPHSAKAKNYQNLTTISPGMFGYSLLRSGQHQAYCNALLDDLESFGIPIDGLHTETGPGVYEAAIAPSDALEAADRGVLFKASVKEIAHRFNYLASFMARVDKSLPGSGGHMHISMLRDNMNCFYDSAKPLGMSEIMQSFIAGQSRYAPELCLLYAPNVNSYKRLVEGFWAPTKSTWGVDNRTCALRVIPKAQATRVEVRISGADMNPYLALAAALGSGIQGVKHGLKNVNPPVSGNGYADNDAPKLPRNLGEAIELFRHSEIAHELFGSEFVNHFASSRDWEWRKFLESISDWERCRYFEII